MTKSLEEWIEDPLVAKIASVCHAANKAWCEANGDFSQPAWGQAPDWQMKSAKLGVAQCFADMKIKTPKESHMAWVEHKVAEGWVFGAVKDPDNKTHPCITPWSQLPFEARMKDHIFVSIVAAFLEGN